MALSKKQKKFIRNICIAGVIYLVGFSGALDSDDGAMGKAMREVRAEVASARKKIQKEMDKPFILRLFGSLFSMEGNTFSGMKERIPKILKSAMPDLVSQFTEDSPASNTACEGMRLLLALEYLHQRKVSIASLSWTFDDTLDDSGVYLMLPGQILKVREDEQGAAHLLIQMVHSYVDEDGLGDDATTRATNLAVLKETAETLSRQDQFLSDWLRLASTEDRNAALSKGLPLVSWSALPVAFADDYQHFDGVVSSG